MKRNEADFERVRYMGMDGGPASQNGGIEQNMKQFLEEWNTMRTEVEG